MARSKSRPEESDEPPALSGMRRAAILLVSLPREQAALLLRHLAAESVEEVTREIAGLSDVADEHRAKVIEEFHGLALARSYATHGGLNYARDLLSKALPQHEADRILTQVEQQMYRKPFSFLHRTESENLLTFIQEEHPQTIALILAHLPPEKSSEVLHGLALEKQIEVINRIARMEQTSPDVIKEVERGLETRLSGMMTERLQKLGGVQPVAEMLNLTDRATEKAILEAMEQEDPELVDEIRRRMFVFEDILLVNDRGIQSVLKEIENADLILALKTASEDLKKKIFGNMSERASQLVKEEMEYMGPVRIRDVEVAQQKIVDVVRRLEESGEIVIAGRGGEKEIVV